jgi:uncharacterized protein (TIGR03118 family)
MSSCTRVLTGTASITLAVAATVIGAAGPPAAQAVAPGNSYAVTSLVADTQGAAPFNDPSLVNGWGMSQGPTTPVWVSDNGTDVTTLYKTGDSPPKQNLTVTIPDGSPTGQVFNADGGAFLIPGPTGMQAAIFLFASEAGSLSAWNGAQPKSTDPVTGAISSTAVTVVPQAADAVFKGLAIGSADGRPRLYATDFHNGRVDVFDGSFAPVVTSGAFVDPHLPGGYAPFGIQVIGGSVFVSYAVQDSAAHDDVAGQGHGIIDVFTADGSFMRRLAQHGQLDSPWGMVMAPADFGRFGGDLLVGNFGDGRIHAFAPRSGNFRGTLADASGGPVVIDGLWGLLFGNGTSAPTSTLMFSAGPQDESHGLFGVITSP